MLALRVTGKRPGESFVLPLPMDGRAFILGRGEGSDFALPDDEKSIGRRHVRVRVQIEVEDLESKNGTWRNGERVQKASLVPGDEFSIGLSDRFRIAVVDAPDAAVSPMTIDSPPPPPAQAAVASPAPSAKAEPSAEARAMAEKLRDAEAEIAKLRGDLDRARASGGRSPSGILRTPSGGIPGMLRPSTEDGRSDLEELKNGFALLRGEKSAPSAPRPASAPAGGSVVRPPASGHPSRPVARLAENLPELKQALLRLEPADAEARLVLLFGSFFVFSRAVEKFTTRQARHLENILEMMTLLPGLERNLGMLVDDFLSKGDDASLDRVQGYLETLRRNMGACVLNYQKGAQQWARSLLERIRPEALEARVRVSATTRLANAAFGAWLAREFALWQAFRHEIGDLDADRALDEIEQMAAAVSRESAENL